MNLYPTFMLAGEGGDSATVFVGDSELDFDAPLEAAIAEGITGEISSGSDLDAGEGAELDVDSGLTGEVCS